MNQEPLRVLLADDEISFREPLAKHLRRTQGYEVDTAADGQGVLYLLEQRRGGYDVALIDDLLVPLPGCQPEPLGVALTQAIKTRYPNIEVIIFTGWGMQSGLEVLRAGAYRYLAKPFNLEELGMLIQTAAEHSRLRNVAREKQILEELIKSSTALLSGQSLPEVLDTILHGVQAIGFDRVGLYLLSEDRQMMVGQAQADMPGEFVKHIRPVLTDIYMQALIANPRPQVFEREDEEPLPYEQELGREGVKQWACVPLVLQEEVIGKLTMDNKFSQRPIIEAELGPVALFASQAAAAIENTRLRDNEREATQRAEQRARNLKAVQEVATAISSLMELDKILEATCRAAVELFEVDHSGLVLFEESDYSRGWVAAEYPDLGAHGLEIPVQGIPAEEDLIQFQKPLVLADVSKQDPSLGPIQDIFHQFNICSILIVPVVNKGRVLGSFSLEGIGQPHTFTDEEIEQCQIFAAQVAVAVENARLYKDVAQERDRSEWMAEQLMALYQITQEIQSELNLPNLLNLISRLAAELLGADAGGILLLDDEQRHLTFKGAYGLSQKAIEGTRDLVGRSIAGRVVKTGEPIIANDIPNDTRFENPAAGDEGWLAIMSTPLQVGGKIIGTLDVHSKRERHAFDGNDLRILSLMASQAAIAIENARLFAELSEQKDHWARLVASSPNGVIAVDRQGNITGFNEQAQGILKYRFEDVLGQSVNFLYDDPQESRKVGKLLHTALDGKLANYETFIRSQEGECIPIHLAATWLYDAQGNQIGSVGYFEDLRSIKAAEQRLELLLKASNTVAQANNLTVGLQSLAEMIVTFLDVDFCRCFLLDESHQILLAKAAYPTPLQLDQLAWDPGPEEQIILADWPLLAEVLAEWNPKVLRIDDKRHRSFLTRRSNRLGLKQNIQSLFLVPLKARNKVVGLLALAELHSWAQAPFSKQKQELAVAIADQVAMLIDRIHLYEIMDRHRQLLIALERASRHIRAEKETLKLLQEVVRLAADLVGCTAGGLYINHPQLKELELYVTYELPPQLIGNRLSYTEGLVGLVARTNQSQIIFNYSDWPNRENILETYHLKTVVGIPLRQAGEVEAVLFVATQTSLRQFVQTDLEILESFAVQASIALQTSRLLTQEQRMFRPLAILHRVSDYIQAARDLDKIAHVVLTGITAGYGLGFNRAALLLLDEQRENLVGRMGIGHLDEEATWEDWALHNRLGREDFKQYLELLEQDALPLTPIGQRIRGLQLPLSVEQPEVFSQVVLTGEYTLVTQEQLDTLPSSFIEAFEPALPFIVVPLLTRDQVIGLLVVDNKFTRASITPKDIDSLLTFANTAAVTLDNLQLFHETQLARERFRFFFEASNAFVSSQNPEQVLRDTVEQACGAAGASKVSIVLIDQIDQARSLITVGVDEEGFDIGEMIRPNGLSTQIIRTGQIEVIEDMSKQRERVNPTVFQRGIAAALGLPISLEGKRFGVMWINYDRPHHFSESEIEALRLYVNQTAIAYDSARRIEQLERMRRAAEALASVVEPPEVLRQILQNARQVLKADSVSVSSYDAVRGKFSLKGSVAAGILLGVWQQFCPEGFWQSQTDSKVMEQRWVGVEDVANGAQYTFLEESTQQFLRQIEVQSFQGIALTVGEEQLGILYVNYHRPRSFSEQERETARTFTNHAALALKRAKLLEQISKVRNTVKVVAEVTALGNLDDTLRSVAEGTVEVVNCDAVALYVYDQDKDKFGHPPTMIGVQHPERAARFQEVVRDSIVFEMLKRDRLYRVDDVAADPLFRDRRFAVEEQIKSEVAIPLKVGLEKVGVMFINYRTLHRFTADELTNIELFANQAAVAIRNAQLYERVQKRAGTRQALYEAGHAITRSLDLQEILNCIVEQAPRVIRYQGKQISFACMTIEGLPSRVVAAYPKEKLVQAQEACGDDLAPKTGKNSRIGIIGRTALIGEPQRVGDVSVDPDYLPCIAETRSELAVPIKLNGKVIGVINVEHPDYDAFDEEDQQALQSLAAQASAAIQKAGLFEQIQRHARLLAAAAEVAHGATDIHVDKLLNEAVRLISEVFEVYHTGIFLLDEARNYAVLQATYPQTGQGMLKLGHRLKVGQEGIVGFVTQTGKPHFAPEVNKDPYYLANPNLPLTRSEMVFPLTARGQVIGALDMQSTEVVNLQEEDIATLQTMADQLANAIHNAQLYQQATERLLESNTLQQVAFSLAGASELREVLKLVMMEALKLTITQETLILFWDVYTNEFTQGLRIDSNGILQPYLSQARKEGFTRLIVTERKPIVISDTQQEPHVNPILITQGCRAIFGVPLLSQGEVIGVLYVRSKEPRQFSDRQVALLEALASQAAVALDRARQYEELKKTYEELKRTKGLVGARTALAWMGMATSTWRHAIDKHAITIREQVQLLSRNLDQTDPTQQYPQLSERLSTIERLASKILEKPLTPPLTAEEGVESVTINDLIGERAKQLWQNEPYKTATLQIDLQLSGAATVKISREWLRRAFDILVDNAIDAVAGCEVRSVVIGTRPAQEGAEIFVSDTGPGLPQEIQEKIGLEVIEKPEDAKGLGMGLLMAQTIVQTYGGALRVGATGPVGTMMVIWLPLENMGG